MKHLILVGACYLDTILSVPHFPEEDSKLRATSLQIRRGGNCPNSLEVLQQLIQDADSIQQYLVSCLPQQSSAATQRILSSFNQDGASSIDFDHCIYRPDNTEPASSYIIRGEKTGSRTIVNYNDLPEMTVEEFSKVTTNFSSDQVTWWHFEGRIPDVTLECIHHLRRALPEARISVEVEKPGRPGLEELAAEADIVFYSRTWAEHRGYASAEECLKAQAKTSKKTSLSFCPWGADGAAAYTHATQEFVFAPVNTSSTITVKDAIGAGDTFIAGVLFGLLARQTDPLAKSLQFAVNLATLKVQRDGFTNLGNDINLA